MSKKQNTGPSLDQLKRCEVCEYYNIDIENCSSPIEWCELDDPEFSEIPQRRTCSRWQWDQHDTKGDANG